MSLIKIIHRNSHRLRFLGTGALIQLIPILASPVLARQYSPSDYGTYAVYYSVFNTLYAVATLALTNGILTDLSDESASQTLRSSLATALIIAIVTEIVLILIINSNAIHVKPRYAEVAPFLPVSLLLAAVVGTINTWALRKNELRVISRNRLILAVATTTIQLLMGLGGFGVRGLVWANLSGLICAVVIQVPLLKTQPTTKIWSLSIQEYKTVIKRHRKFALWTTPSNLISSLATQLPEILMVRYFGAAIGGQFSMGNRVVTLPLQFLSNGIQELFSQKSSACFRNRDNARPVVYRFMLLQAFIALALLVPVMAFAPTAMGIILGGQWKEAGTLITATSWLLIVRFISSPISYIWLINNKQSENLMWQLGLIALTGGAFWITSGTPAGITPQRTLKVYCILTSIWYSLAILLSVHWADFREKVTDVPAT
jgi:O-antigen/teichoic acid export membrane protein